MSEFCQFYAVTFIMNKIYRFKMTYPYTVKCLFLQTPHPNPTTINPKKSTHPTVGMRALFPQLIIILRLASFV